MARPPTTPFWSGFGGDCETSNDGDPIVLYDQLADRWLLSQFTAGGPEFFNCVALSVTGDATGSYYRWAFSTGPNFPDYPKYGVWRDAYYISTREFAPDDSFAGVGAYAIDRGEMLAGKADPQVISFLVPPGVTPYNVGDGLLPADIDGATLPPAGADEIFVGSMDNGGPYGAAQDALTIWRFNVDFATPGNSSFTLANTVNIAAYDTIFPCSPSSRECIPQPGTGTKVDILSYRQRPLHRLAYRNFGTHESLVTNQAVEGAVGMAGIRWWEIRDPNGSPAVFQEGTYVPGSADSIHRWMGSTAMDVEGNLALGYSASAATGTFPSLFYTGRLVGDTLGTLPQGEAVIQAGAGSQTGSSRWGDYSSMNVDPTDDCSFWYVNQYFSATGSNWLLRIGSFKFNECDVPDFTLAATPSAQSVCVGDPVSVTVNAGALRGFASTIALAVSGQPAGTTAGFTGNPISPPGSATLSITNTGAVTPDSYLLTITGTAGALTRSANAALDFASPLVSAPTLTSPANGATGLSTSPTLSWGAVAGAAAYLVEVSDEQQLLEPRVHRYGVRNDRRRDRARAREDLLLAGDGPERLRRPGVLGLLVQHRAGLLPRARIGDSGQRPGGRQRQHGGDLQRHHPRPRRFDPGAPHLGRGHQVHPQARGRRDAGRADRPARRAGHGQRLLERQHRSPSQRRG